MTSAGLVPARSATSARSEEHTSELQSQSNLVCRLLLEKKKREMVTAPNVYYKKQTKEIVRQAIVNKLIGDAVMGLFFLPLTSDGQYFYSIFFFNDTATTEIYTLSLHDALPI